MNLDKFITPRPANFIRTGLEGEGIDVCHLDDNELEIMGERIKNLFIQNAKKRRRNGDSA